MSNNKTNTNKGNKASAGDLYLLSEIHKMADSMKGNYPIIISPYEYVLQNGRPYPQREMPDKYRKLKPTRSGCFNSAFRLAKKNPELRYVEGYALAPLGIVVLHAWCVDSDGRVIDRTWGNDGWYYGVTFDLKFVQRVRERTHHISVIDNWKEHFPLLRSINPERYMREGAEQLPLDLGDDEPRCA